MDAKKKLAESSYDSLDAMMAAYAGEAVRAAKASFGRQLDYTEATLERLEEILSDVAGDADADHDYETKVWGAYFGEVFRRRYNGDWEMTIYPGGQLSVPTLEVKGSRLYPLMKVNRRLTMGEGESVAAFYRMAVDKLGEPTKAN